MQSPPDYHAWIMLLDVLSFVYAAIFYRTATGSAPAPGFEDLGDDTRTLPL